MIQFQRRNGSQEGKEELCYWRGKSFLHCVVKQKRLALNHSIMYLPSPLVTFLYLSLLLVSVGQVRPEYIQPPSHKQ